MAISRTARSMVNPIPGSPNPNSPGWDILTAIPASATSVALSWTAATGASGYQVSNGLAIIDVGNVTSYTYTGLTIGQQYTFSVRAYSSLGIYSGWSYASVSTPNWAAATGGTVSTVSNYNGTGQTWKTHVFTTSGTFSVSSGGTEFKILIVGGGGSGGSGAGNANDSRGGGGGGAGGVYSNNTVTFSAGNHTITVGGAAQASSVGAMSAAAGSNGATGNNGGSSGSPTTFSGGSQGPDTYHRGGGGGGGAGGAGGGGSFGGGGGGAGLASTITGASVTYGIGGDGGASNVVNANGATGAGYGGGGGGGNWNSGGLSGNAGVVIIAYRTA